MMSLKAKHMGIEPEQKPKSNAQIMREEITTLEQFEAIGNYREVAAKYGVGKTAANDLHVKLRREKEKMYKVNVFEVGGNKPVEIPCQSVQNVVESVKNESEGDCSKEGIEEAQTKLKETPSGYPCFGTYEDVEGTDCGVCHMGLLCKFETDGTHEETKDDLQGLVEPEPTWDYDLIAEELEKPVSDADIWDGIEEDLKLLRERAHKRVDHEITNKFLRLMGCGNDSAEGLEGGCELGK